MEPLVKGSEMSGESIGNLSKCSWEESRRIVSPMTGWNKPPKLECIFRCAGSV